jgi:flagellar motor protein MotB
MPETIGRQAASYRQGLVLGLTMAEIMLLLVFCMLIAVGVGLANERTKLLDAMLRLKQVEAAAAADKAIIETIKRNPRLTELLSQATGSASQRDIDEFWRKLVESNDVVTKLGRQGVSLVALKEESDSLVKMQRLLKDGIDPDKIARGMALASAIDQTGSAKSGPRLTPEQVVTLIEKGIAASKLQSANERGRGQHNWPPIINLSEAGGYYFASGNAVLTADFALALRTIVIPRLLEIVESFDVDVIEVIGHTDEQPVTSHASNLDRHLSSVTLGGADAAVLQWSDNAGLGLARALAVVKVLASDARLAAFRILPLSGAQLIDTDGRLTRWEGGDVRERRRIEIRMRKSN